MVLTMQIKRAAEATNIGLNRFSRLIMAAHTETLHYSVGLEEYRTREGILAAA